MNNNNTMVSVMRTVFVVVLAVVLTALAFSGAVKEGSFQAVSDGSNITLRWLTESESNVAHYIIEKRTGTEGEFITIATLDPRGISMYEFTDYSDISKVSSLYQYRIKVMFANDPNPQYIGPVTVTHSVSGVRKTWGSIKALFR